MIFKPFLGLNMANNARNLVTENDSTILKNFGGTIVNNLNSILKNSEDITEDPEYFSHSSYFDLDTISGIKLPNNRTFKVLSLNAQSINAKFDSITSFLQSLNDTNIIFDAILLQETWLSESYISDPDNLALYQIPGYQLFSQGKKCCAHGGLFTYVRDIYKCLPLLNVNKNSTVYEALFMNITNEDMSYKVTIGNIYRPPKNNNDYRNVSTFLEEIHPVIDQLDKEKSLLILGGDFNINLLEINRKEKYQDFLPLEVK